MTDDFQPITVPPTAVLLTAAQAQSGPPIDPLTRIFTYDSAEWEKFIDEWVSHCLKPDYVKVARFSGANDRGIDIAGFADADALIGVWDSYQCKHYQSGITPSEAWPEIGKILWHSFNGHYKPPRAYYFVAPRDTGTTLTQFLSNTPLLKKELLAAWAKNVETNITSKVAVKLEGDFAQYVDKFDFSIFKRISPREIVEQHRNSPYFIPRFGGGLPPRPAPGSPPSEIDGDIESGYVTKLLDAYADHTKEPVGDIAALKKWKALNEHFHRERESFYHAESLRVFVRDKVEPGTFEGLQDEIYHGVVDTCDGDHADGFERVKAVTALASNLALDAHPLGPAAFVRDRRGICHQLANEDRLKWTK
jgi:hypothetical protein